MTLQALVNTSAPATAPQYVEYCKPPEFNVNRVRTCYRVSYFTSSTDTTANDNRITTVVVNINGEAALIPSGQMLTSTCRSRRASRSKWRKFYNCHPEQSN